MANDAAGPPPVTPLITRYWAKARPAAEATVGWHPFLWHALDVAACAEALLAAHTTLAARLRALAGEEAATLATALAVLHDLGKLSRFQAKAPAVWAEIRPDVPLPRGRQTLHHADVGYVIWLKAVEGTALSERRRRRALRALLPAVFGHHGVPADPHGEAATRILHDETDAEDRAAAQTLTGYAFEDIGGGADRCLAALDRMSESGRARLSFLLAAVVNIADWLGSNQDWFPYVPPAAHTPESYWRTLARPRARQAVADSGVVPACPGPRTGFAALFPGLPPRPLQARADDLRLPSGQGLILIEDAAGSGKTEAADVLAARMMAAGLGRGIYLALPTTATAARMAERHEGLHRRLFDGAAPPTLTLVHSGAGETGVRDGGSAAARAWMTGDRRRQLAAEVAVGTVDQALLAALPVRFASARLFALAPKVLVVDEVHAHDDYTGWLLRALLRLHAALGGSAVLLSATLTARLKHELCAAFAQGAGRSAPSPEDTAGDAYPAITTLDADAEAVRITPVPPHPGACRRIAVTTSEDAAAVRDHLLASARAGGCALWMRNTVDDAIAATDELAAEHPDVTLLHARFAAARRSALETEIARRFGPASTGAERAGAIVVATQVLEQSLDLDFDAMVVDLKPMDALIQSAGRFRRHPREAAGDPAPDGKDKRGAATLWVHGPVFTEMPDGDWYRRVLGRASAVYPRIDWLWRTARELARHGELRQPEALRPLIEAALCEDEGDLPAGISAAAAEAVGHALADRGLARGAALSPERGYTREEGQWPGDVAAPTRLGESVELCLVVVDDAGAVRPWGPAGFEDGFLRVRAGWLAPVRAFLEADPDAAAAPPERALRWRVVVAMRRSAADACDDAPAAWHWTAPDGTRLIYDDARGLRKADATTGAP